MQFCLICKFFLENVNEDNVKHYSKSLFQITFSVDNCVTAASAYPLTYQMYRVIDTDGNTEAITEKQTVPTFNTVGKAARKGTTQNTFLVKVRLVKNFKYY